MKKSISNSVCVGALIVSSLVIAHCGGDDSGSPGFAGTTTPGGDASTGVGAGGSVGNGGSTTGGGGTVSTGAGGSTGLGGSASTGAGGTASTGVGGTASTGAGGSPNGSFCPAAEPTAGDACTPPPADAGAAANACVYPGVGNNGADRSCSCRAGVARNDAGMRIDTWVCMNVVARPDAGRPPVVDAGLMDMCPANNVANNGNCTQFVTGLVCPGAAGRTCTCRALGMGGGAIKTWNCVAAIPDAGRGGG